MEEDGDAIVFSVSDQPLDVTFHPSEPIVLSGVFRSESLPLRAAAHGGRRPSQLSRRARCDVHFPSRLSCVQASSPATWSSAASGPAACRKSSATKCTRSPAEVSSSTPRSAACALAPLRRHPDPQPPPLNRGTSRAQHPPACARAGPSSPAARTRASAPSTSRRAPSARASRTPTRRGSTGCASSRRRSSRRVRHHSPRPSGGLRSTARQFRSAARPLRRRQRRGGWSRERSGGSGLGTAQRPEDERVPFPPCIGDDDGHVKLWDTRARSSTGAWRVHKARAQPPGRRLLFHCRHTDAPLWGLSVTPAPPSSPTAPSASGLRRGHVQRGAVRAAAHVQRGRHARQAGPDGREGGGTVRRRPRRAALRCAKREERTATLAARFPGREGGRPGGVGTAQGSSVGGGGRLYCSVTGGTAARPRVGALSPTGPSRHCPASAPRSRPDEEGQEDRVRVAGRAPQHL